MTLFCRCRDLVGCENYSQLIPLQHQQKLSKAPFSKMLNPKISASFSSYNSWSSIPPRWWFQTFLEFSPRNLGKMNPFWLAHIFSNGLVKNHQLEYLQLPYLTNGFPRFGVSFRCSVFRGTEQVSLLANGVPSECWDDPEGMVGWFRFRWFVLQWEACEVSWVSGAYTPLSQVTVGYPKNDGPTGKGDETALNHQHYVKCLGACIRKPYIIFLRARESPFFFPRGGVKNSLLSLVLREGNTFRVAGYTPL